MFFKKIDQSCALMLGMADRLDRDVLGEVNRNPETQTAAFRSAILRCASCREQQACQKLQAANAQLDAAPSYCTNTWD